MNANVPPEYGGLIALQEHFGRRAEVPVDVAFPHFRAQGRSRLLFSTLPITE